MTHRWTGRSSTIAGRHHPGRLTMAATNTADSPMGTRIPRHTSLTVVGAA